jgi:hypothetical protein
MFRTAEEETIRAKVRTCCAAGRAGATGERSSVLTLILSAESYFALSSSNRFSDYITAQRQLLPTTSPCVEHVSK